MNVFDRETADKAKRSCRLLFIDGHGSHLNLRFLEWCYMHRILIACYPPHSTHRLQRLDVGCFNPLAHFYSEGLDQLIGDSEGYTALKKRDFFAIFWQAFEKAFIERNIDSAWRKTGIWPWDPEVVLKSFLEPLPPSTLAIRSNMRSSDSPPSVIGSPTTTKRLRKMVNRAAARIDRRASKLLVRMGENLLKSQSELTSERRDNLALRSTLARERRHKKRQKRVVKELRAEGASSTLFLSPSKIRRAREIEEGREQHEADTKARKQARKAQQAQDKLHKELELQQQRSEKAAAAQEKKDELAAKKAEKKAAREAEKAIKASQQRQKTTRKAPAVISKPQKLRKKRIAVVAAPVVEEVEIEARTTSGRIVRRTAKTKTQK